jgi:hypothetical protein
MGKETLTIKLPYPHTGQIAVRSQARRFNWLSAGRRWRKTTLMMPIGAESVVRGHRLVWGAPTYSQTRIGWEELQKAVGDTFKFNVQRMTATFPRTGGQIVYRSLDNPDNARGYTADGVLFDEAGDIKPAAWYEVCRPMLIDTGGYLWASGTPKGRNWFWREHIGANRRTDSVSWQIPTVGCRIDEQGVLHREEHPYENPEIDYDEIVHIFNTTPISAFRQEILAEFLENEGTVFKNILANLLAPLGAHPFYHQKHRMVAGIDWGKQNDFTAISIGCVTCGEEVEMKRFNRIGYAFQRDQLASLIHKWGVKYAIAESNSIGDPNLEMLQREGLPVVPFDMTSTSKPPLIENMILSMDKAAFQFLDIREATEELEAFERTISRVSNRAKYGAPEGSGFHDDTVIARALMLKATKSVPVPKEQPEKESKWYSGVASKWRKF